MDTMKTMKPKQKQYDYKLYRTLLLRFSLKKHAKLIEDFDKFCVDNDMKYAEVIRQALRNLLYKGGN